MPIIVPRLAQQQVEAAPVNAPAASTHVPNAGAAVGEGLTALGAGIAIYHQKASEIAVMGYETEYQKAISSVQIGTPEEPGYQYSLGKEAVDRRPFVDERIKQIGDDIEAGIEDEDQKAAFSRLRENLYIRAREKNATHALEQDALYRKASTKDAVDTSTQAGVDAVLGGTVKYGPQSESPSGTNGPDVMGTRALDESLNDALKAFSAYAQQQEGVLGQDGVDEMIKQGHAQIRENYWAKVIGATLEAGPNRDPRIGNALLKQHGPELRESRGDVQSAVSDAYVDDMGLRLGDSLFAKHAQGGAKWTEKTNGAIAELPKAGENPEQQAINKRAEARIRENTAKAINGQNAAQAESLEAMKKGIDAGEITAANLRTPDFYLMDADAQQAAINRVNSVATGARETTDANVFAETYRKMLTDPSEFVDVDINLLEMSGKLEPQTADFFRSRQDSYNKAYAAGREGAQDSYVLSADKMVGQASRDLYPDQEDEEFDYTQAKNKARYEFTMKVAAAELAWRGLNSGRAPSDVEYQNDILGPQIDQTKIGETMQPEEEWSGWNLIRPTAYIRELTGMKQRSEIYHKADVIGRNIDTIPPNRQQQVYAEVYADGLKPTAAILAAKWAQIQAEEAAGPEPGFMGGAGMFDDS